MHRGIPREAVARPVCRWPFVTLGLVLLNVLVFWYWQWDKPLSHVQAGIFEYGLMPVEFTTHTDLPPVGPYPYWISLWTMMFLHVDVAHLLSNMIYLLVFGSYVERRMGHWTYLVFFLVCGLGADALQVWSNPMSWVPSIGASGPVSGVMAAFLLLLPRHCSVPFKSWQGIFVMVSAILLGLWAGTQALMLWAYLEFGLQANVAHMAHLGGVLTGGLLTLVILLIRRLEALELQVNAAINNPRHTERWG